MTAWAGGTACSTCTGPLPANPDGRLRRLAPYVLDPDTLPDHIDALYRAAWALCGSRADAEDLVQTTFVQVLKRPRIIRNGNERGYLLRALRNTYATRYRTLSRRPATVPLLEDDTGPAAEPAATISSRELMEAVASAPPPAQHVLLADFDRRGWWDRRSDRLLISGRLQAYLDQRGGAEHGESLPRVATVSGHGTVTERQYGRPPPGRVRGSDGRRAANPRSSRRRVDRRTSSMPARHRDREDRLT